MDGAVAFTSADIRAFLTGRGETGPLREAFETAMSLWGYDYHHPVAVLRQNDGLVRRLAKTALEDAVVRLEALANAYKLEKVPPVSREHPFPSEDAKRAMDRAHKPANTIKNFAGLMTSLEVPTTDGFAKRLRDEQATLENLMTVDIEMIVSAKRIDALAAALDLAALDNGAALQPLNDACTAFNTIIKRRRDLIVM